jgi:hypothetical protein
MHMNDLNSSVNTSCRNCCFAVYKGDTQLGCLQDRIDKFGDSVTGAYDNAKEFYVINRFCNYYRDRAWGYSEADIEKVRLESSSNFSIFVDCNDICKIADSTTEYIRNIDYTNNKIDIILFHDSNNFSIVKDSVANIARNCGKNVSISVASDSTDHFLHACNKKNKSYFHCLLKNLDTDGLDFAHKINNFVNYELGRCFVIEYCGNLFVNNHIYRAVAYLNEYHLYDDVIQKLLDESHKLGTYIKL